MIYKKVIPETFEKHGVDNKELENAMIELFSKFESHMLSNGMIRKLDERLKEHEDRRKKAWGG